MDHEKTTVPSPTVGAVGEQPLSKETIRSITESQENCNDKTEELLKKLLKTQDPNYLHTMTLNELFDSIYLGSPPIV